MTMHIVSLKNIYGLAHVIHHAGLPINEYMLRGIVKHQPLFGVFYSFQGQTYSASLLATLITTRQELSSVVTNYYKKFKFWRVAINMRHVHILRLC